MEEWQKKLLSMCMVCSGQGTYFIEVTDRTGRVTNRLVKCSQCRGTGQRRRKVKFFLAWYDMWIGAYWSRKDRILYICPFFMCVIAIPIALKKKIQEKTSRNA